MEGAFRGSKLFSCSLLFVRNNFVLNFCSRPYLTQRRKPAHLPVGKTKLFRIPEHPYFPPEEVKLIDDLLAEYKRRIASLSLMFRKELEKTSGKNAAVQAEEEAIKEHQQLMELNRLENERVRKIREETLELEFQEKVAHLLQLQEELEAEKQERKRMLLEAIEKAKAETYVTADTLEQAIEHALDNPVNYNFCIDLNGQVYWEEESTKDKYRKLSGRVSSQHQQQSIC